MNTDLIIIGAGAAGLMAAACAADAGLKCILLERRHRAGLKLLLCGNNRCNISHQGSAESMLNDYGDPVGPFLQEAMKLLPPKELQSWLAKRGLRTKIQNERIYPVSENADDVLHCFTDYLRDKSIPIIFNCPANKITASVKGTFRVHCEKLTLESNYVLLATGGVSYPKTGSVGDGQRIASQLGHKLEPYRPALAGVEADCNWLNLPAKTRELNINEVKITVFDNKQEVDSREGNLLIDKKILRGTAVFDAVRIINRRNLKNFSMSIDFFPKKSQKELADEMHKVKSDTKKLTTILQTLGMDRILADNFSKELTKEFNSKDFLQLAEKLKRMPLGQIKIRPLKEAIVSMGGVSLSDINKESMESKLHGNLYFAGEVMDIDGPTGGYNLHAAFCTAQLAIKNIREKINPARSIKRETRHKSPKRQFRKRR